MLRPAVLIDGVAAGTWGLAWKHGERSVRIEWFGRPIECPELRSEQLDVERFLEGG